MALTPEEEARLLAVEAAVEQMQGLPLPEGPQVSFPVTGYQADMPEWMGILQSFANGVIDHGGSPFSMTVSDVDDSITVDVESNTGVNEALVRGIGYRQSAPVKLYAPAVSSPTRYMVGLEHDPAYEADPEQAVRLVCIPLGLWASPTDKIRFKLAAFDRNPSQLLSDAWGTRTVHNMRLSPTVFAATVDALPTRAEGALWGQTAIVGPAAGPWSMYICVGGASGQQWLNVSAPDWQDLWLPSARKWAGFGCKPQFQKVPGMIRVRGVFRRTDDSAYTAGGNFTLGSITGLAGGEIPDVVRWGGGTGLGGGQIIVESNGDIIATPARDVWTIGIDGLTVYTK